MRQKRPTRLRVFSDSNHADCPFTRKSTSCTVTMHGQHAIQFSSTTQVPVSLSSGESEWHGLVKSSATGLGLQAMARDYNMELELDVYTDSTAAKGIGSRRGAGRIKHLDTSTFWVQQLVAAKKLRIFKQDGATSVADLGTKHLSRVKINQLMALLGMRFEKGRHKLSLKMSKG